MIVLVADQFEQSGIDGLRAAGCEVFYDAKLADETLVEALRQTRADVLVVRSTKVTAAMMDVGPLALIVRAGAGYNTIDVAAASARGIYVSNCPGKNAVAVAELAFGLLLALDRRIPDNVAALRAGQWNKKEFSKAAGIKGKTLGLIGYGSIGRAMAIRARAFEMHLAIWSRHLGSGEPDLGALGLDDGHHDLQVTLAASPADVAAKSDALSVHVALAAETKRLIDAAVLDRLKPGAFFINTARAEVVDHAALDAAIASKGLRVALDVFRDEPSAATAAFTDPIVARPNVYGTHHVGASTEQAQEAIAAETVRIVSTFRETGRVPNVVNLATRTPATHMLVVRHRDRPGVLAHVFDQLRSASINVQETENIIFAGAEAAVARINLDKRPTDAVLALMTSGNEHILSAQLIAIT
jgi:D-3-phosphoglycerate dehydrogenase / 2-oxoglutarate reductase